MHENIQVDTLFINNNSLDQPIDIEHNPVDQVALMDGTIGQLNRIFYSCMPKELFFYAVDGVLPVSRYQMLRENKLGTAIKYKMDRNYTNIDEKAFKDITKDQDPFFF